MRGLADTQSPDQDDTEGTSAMKRLCGTMAPMGFRVSAAFTRITSLSDGSYLELLGPPPSIPPALHGVQCNTLVVTKYWLCLSSLIAHIAELGARKCLVSLRVGRQRRSARRVATASAIDTSCNQQVFGSSPHFRLQFPQTIF